MNTPWILLIALASLAAVYVLFPVAFTTFLSYRDRRVLYCPETGKKANINIDAHHAALGSLFGRTKLRVRDCTLWPGKKYCKQECLHTLTPATGMPRELGRI
jgi:hypothetical protein